MRYSQQQILDIKRRQENIQQEIKNSNKRNKAIQDIIVDKKIEESLLDKRNAGDIENDNFYRQSLLNDYSNELIKNGNVYQFQTLIQNEGYDEFFLNNYPKIKSESKMYRTANVQTMFDLVKRLYNINKKELDYTVEQTIINDNNDNIKALLSDILLNLNGLVNNTPTSQQQQQIYMDTIARLDALNMTLSNVDNQILFLQDVFGEAYPDIKAALIQLKSQTQIPSNPNIPVQPPVLLQQVSQNITQNSLQQAMNNQTTQPQQQPNMKTDLLDYEEADYEFLKDMVNNNAVNRETYANILSRLSDGIYNVNKFGLNKGESKEYMYNFFMKKKGDIETKLRNKLNERETSEKIKKYDEENQKKRIDDDRSRVIEDKRTRLKESEKLKTQYDERIRKIGSVSDIILKKLELIEKTDQNNDSDGVYRRRMQELLKVMKGNNNVGYIVMSVNGSMSGDDIKNEIHTRLDNEWNRLDKEYDDLVQELEKLNKIIDALKEDLK